MDSKLKDDEKLIEELPPMEDVTTPKTKDFADTSNMDISGVEGKEPNLPTLIAAKVEMGALLFTDGKEKTYVQFKVSDHKETWPINSRRFTGWLYKIGKPLNKNEDIPGPECITTVRKYLEALAYEKQEIELYNRVAKFDGHFWYDLTNERWEAVKINNKTWVIEDNFPPLFIRLTHQKKQVIPTKGGNVWDLFEFIKVPDNKKLLFLIYIISCFVPDIPHPVIIIFGPAGSGKSMTMEFVREIIDPSQAPRLKTPKKDKEIVQVFDHHYATYFDNLDILPNSFSDIICRAVTGEGSEFRALYSDDGAVIRKYRRCVGLNGINIAATQADLFDRSILIQLEKFPDGVRVEEHKLRENFELAKPGILGGIFDYLVKAKRIYPSVELESLPRMADFAKWGYAIGEALGGYGEEFLKSYLEDENERVHETVHQNNLATAVTALIKERKSWKGTAADLLEELETVAANEKIQTNLRSWPKSPSWVTRQLNSIQSTLEHLGISIERTKENGQRFLTIKFGENTDNGVMLSEKVNEPSKNESKDNIVTGHITRNDSEYDSKIKNQSLLSKLDCNDRTDIKLTNLESQQVVHEKTSQLELFRMAACGDDNANDLLKAQTLEKSNSKDKVLK